MPLYGPSTPTNHASRHEDGGSDEIDVTGLEGLPEASGADNETPTGTINGVNDTFTLAAVPAGSVRVYRNGLRQRAGAGNDYTISGDTITFEAGNIPQTGDILLVDYSTGGGGGGGSSVRDGAKIYVSAAALSQLSNGGYVWDATDFDDSGYVTTYGTHSPQQVDASAVVFAIPADGTYVVQGVLKDGNSTGGLQDQAAIRLVTQRNSGFDSMHQQPSFGVVRGANAHDMLGSPFSWVGELTAATDQYVALWTSLAVTLDKIAQGSWVSILRLY